MFTCILVNIQCQAIAFDLLKGRSQVKIPFSFVQGFIVVDVYYQYFIPMSFIFDTGAQNTIIFDKASTDFIKTEYDKEIVIMGADYSEEVEALIARKINLSLPDQKINVDRDVLVLKKDVANIGSIVGQKIHGILGNNFFKGMTVEIDFKKSMIIIHDPRRFDPKKYASFHTKDLLVKESKPYIYASSYINGSHQDSLKYLIDTGASLSLLFQVNQDNRIVIPEGTMEGSLGRGLGGEVIGFVGQIDTFHLAKHVNFLGPLSYFQKLDSLTNEDLLFRDGIIGNSLLERFHIVVDYYHNKFYFKPTKKYNRPFEYDKSGMTVIASGPRLKSYIVSTVMKGSPADKSGIKPGDEILSVNWLPHFLIDLNVINKAITGKEFKVVKFKIKRGDMTFKKEIMLENLFKLNTKIKY